MTVYWIATSIKNANTGEGLSMFLETKHESLDDLSADLTASGHLCGNRISFAMLPDGTRHIKGRAPYLVTAPNIVSVQPCGHRFV